MGKDLCTNSTHNTYTGRAEDSPGVMVRVVVVVEEAEGAVETERGGWEVGRTAVDEEDEGEGATDSAAREEKHSIEPTLKHKPLQSKVHTVIHGMVSLAASPYFPGSSEHVQTLSLSTEAGWGLAGWGWAGHMMAGTGVLFVQRLVFPAFFRPANTASYASLQSRGACLGWVHIGGVQSG